MVLILLTLPVLILLLSILIVQGHRKTKVEAAEYHAFMQKVEGAKFFCYNNRKNSQGFIETHIIPYLPVGVKIIFVEGRIPKSEFEEKYISKLLFGINYRKGFPYLLKISAGKLKDLSIHHELYNTINQKKDVSVLMKKMNVFFHSN